MEKKAFLDIDDLYCAAFLVLNRIQPKLVPGFGNHITFRFPRTGQVLSLVATFSAENPPVGVRDFAGAIRNLRALMIARKSQA
ncbi:MAG TPA: hypothetical protein ENH32_08275 [Proteobacteria bacterium]|nr:hypothetical protein [Pseudomonadota bacterium]